MAEPVSSELRAFADRVSAAESRIRDHVRETYLEFSPALSTLSGSSVYCKLENLQHSGSFKLRGAFNKILSLSEAERERGIVTSSSGNHGAGVAYALGTLGQAGTVFVPTNVSPGKAQNIERLGGTLTYYGADVVDTDAEACRQAQRDGMTFISPYNDLEVVAGQGTIAVELERQMGDLDAVFVAVGGGGLISGIATYLKATHPDVQIVGCTPENSAVMMRSVQAGRILQLPSGATLSDGTAGGVEDGAITFELCTSFVDHWVAVSETEIANAITFFLSEHRMAIEGAAGVAIAAYRKTSRRYAGKRVAIIVCGGNIELEKLQSILAGDFAS